MHNLDGINNDHRRTWHVGGDVGKPPGEIGSSGSQDAHRWLVREAAREMEQPLTVICRGSAELQLSCGLDDDVRRLLPGTDEGPHDYGR